CGPALTTRPDRKPPPAPPAPPPPEPPRIALDEQRPRAPLRRGLRVEHVRPPDRQRERLPPLRMLVQQEPQIRGRLTRRGHRQEHDQPFWATPPPASPTFRSARPLPSAHRPRASGRHLAPGPVLSTQIAPGNAASVRPLLAA